MRKNWFETAPDALKTPLTPPDFDDDKKLGDWLYAERTKKLAILYKWVLESDTGLELPDTIMMKFASKVGLRGFDIKQSRKRHDAWNDLKGVLLFLRVEKIRINCTCTLSDNNYINRVQKKYSEYKTFDANFLEKTYNNAKNHNKKTETIMKIISKKTSKEDKISAIDMWIDTVESLL